MKKPLVVLALTVLAACSAAAYQETPTAQIRSLLTLAGSRETDPSALDREVLHVDTVPLPRERAWVELIRAWSTFRIPVTGADTINYRIGGSTQPLGLIGQQRPSTWLDCG